MATAAVLPAKAQPSVLRLDYPISLHGATLTEIKIRRPKGKDLKHLPVGDSPALEDMFDFFGILTEQSSEVFDEMDAADLSRLGDLVNGFLALKPAGRKR